MKRIIITLCICTAWVASTYAQYPYTRVGFSLVFQFLKFFVGGADIESVEQSPVYIQPGL